MFDFSARQRRELWRNLDWSIPYEELEPIVRHGKAKTIHHWGMVITSAEIEPEELPRENRRLREAAALVHGTANSPKHPAIVYVRHRLFLHHSEPVVLYPLHESTPPSTDFLESVYALRLLRAASLCQFVGCCLDGPDAASIGALYRFYARGTLQEVLTTSELEIEVEFQLALARDVAFGIETVHSAKKLGAHGRLSSTCIILDSHMHCKIADYGLPSSHAALDFYRAAPVGHLLWCAPELMMAVRQTAPESPIEATLPADIWSLGVVFTEILSRQTPDKQAKVGSDEIVTALQEGTWQPPLPPVVRFVTDLRHLLEWMLRREPAERPSAKQTSALVIKSMR